MTRLALIISAISNGTPHISPHCHQHSSRELLQAPTVPSSRTQPPAPSPERPKRQLKLWSILKGQRAKSWAAHWAGVASFPVLAVFRTGAAIAQEARRPAEFELTELPFGALRIPSCCLKHFKA